MSHERNALWHTTGNFLSLSGLGTRTRDQLGLGRIREYELAH